MSRAKGEKDKIYTVDLRGADEGLPALRHITNQLFLRQPHLGDMIADKLEIKFNETTGTRIWVENGQANFASFAFSGPEDDNALPLARLVSVLDTIAQDSKGAPISHTTVENGFRNLPAIDSDFGKAVGTLRAQFPSIFKAYENDTHEHNRLYGQFPRKKSPQKRKYDALRRKERKPHAAGSFIPGRMAIHGYRRQG
jgi:hypothetical protein